MKLLSYIRTWLMGIGKIFLVCGVAGTVVMTIYWIGRGADYLLFGPHTEMVAPFYFLEGILTLAFILIITFGAYIIGKTPW